MDPETNVFVTFSQKYIINVQLQIASMRWVHFGNENNLLPLEKEFSRLYISSLSLIFRAAAFKDPFVKLFAAFIRNIWNLLLPSILKGCLLRFCSRVYAFNQFVFLRERRRGAARNNRYERYEMMRGHGLQENEINVI